MVYANTRCVARLSRATSIDSAYITAFKCAMLLELINTKRHLYASKHIEKGKIHIYLLTYIQINVSVNIGSPYFLFNKQTKQ